jgi:hypothetical protein
MRHTGHVGITSSRRKSPEGALSVDLPLSGITDQDLAANDCELLPAALDIATGNGHLVENMIFADSGGIAAGDRMTISSFTPVGIALRSVMAPRSTT